MKFLHGAALTREIQRIVKTKSALKIAVAYWGQDALKLTKISTGRKDIRLLCCLKGGKSEPDVIKKFGKRVKQIDNLHAKVIWTKGRAIVSSANMSSNGLPSEEKKLRGLVEAGVLLTDPDQLSSIGRWFDDKYQSARIITKDDLKKAKEARPIGGWGARPTKRGLIDALRDGGPDEFKQQRIAFALWKSPTTRVQQRAISKFLREKPERIEESLSVHRHDFKRLDQYVEWDDIPANTFLIDCRYRRGVISEIYVTKTFDVNKKWGIVVDGEKTRVNFALMSVTREFNYKLARSDKNVIRKSSRALWKKLGRKRETEAGVIWLHDAAPLLLRNA
ncbi:MAG: phospholipase D family protein [Bradyrhizobium sp.]